MNKNNPTDKWAEMAKTALSENQLATLKLQQIKKNGYNSVPTTVIIELHDTISRTREQLFELVVKKIP